MKTKTNSEDLSDISSLVAFDKNIFIKTVKTYFPEADCQNESWLVFDIEDYSIEFNLGKE